MKPVRIALAFKLLNDLLLLVLVMVDHNTHSIVLREMKRKYKMAPKLCRKYSRRILSLEIAQVLYGLLKAT